MANTAVRPAVSANSATSHCRHHDNVIQKAIFAASRVHHSLLIEGYVGYGST
jgi:hypothetical protein